MSRVRSQFLEGAALGSGLSEKLAMNQCTSDWNIEGDIPVHNQRRVMGSDHELVELLWQNGQVVMHSQTQRKPGLSPNESRQVHKLDQPALRGGGSYGNSSNLVPEDETVSWIHYPIEDSLEKEFCSNFFMELQSSDPVESNKPTRQFEDDNKLLKVGATDGTNVIANSQQQSTMKSSVGTEFPGNPMPPPRLQIPNLAMQNPNSVGFGKVVHFSQFSGPFRGDLRSSNQGQFDQKGLATMQQGEVGESSAMTVGSSHCGSNQVANEVSRVSSNRVGDAGLSAIAGQDDAGKAMPKCDRRQTETLETTVTSSSGGSGSSFERTCKQSIDTNSHKRKARDAEESRSQSEAAELESAAGNKPARRSGSARRSRAAEVHNLSERRRRDRINEKMRALQELIPHSNKSDKASMLDEAIEYLKSLQLQLQMMWMGSGMAPMMFPGVQHYMSRMSMGMGPPSLPSMHNPMHLPRIPVVDQSISVTPTPNLAICPNPVLNAVNYQSQMQNPNFPEQYARYMGFHNMQTASLPMNMFSFETQTIQPSQVQSNHAIAPPLGSSSGTSIGGAAGNDALGGKSG